MYVQPLSDFFQKASNTVPRERNRVDANFDSFNQNAFKNQVHNIPEMDEHKIAILVKNNIDEICDDILSANIPYIGLFSDTNFINGFIRAVNSIPISYKIRLACNKLTYDYFTSDNAIYEIKQKYLHISKVVNRIEINRLIVLGIDEVTASNLVLCRYSSTNERTNVKRLNFTLYHKDPNVMTEQIIVWIYENLFDMMSQLFYGIMFETYTPQQEEDFGDNFMEIYGTVGIAILDILNNMTSQNIKRVLLGYIEEWEFRNHPPVRFSLRSLSQDYSHISRVVESLYMDGKYVP